MDSQYVVSLIKISLIAYMFCALGRYEGQIFYWYQQLIKKLPQYISWPLGHCYMCFIGQVCLWFYLIKYYEDYNIIEHLFFISAGIFVSAIYDKIYCWLCE
jgi:hypothetical protein